MSDQDARARAITEQLYATPLLSNGVFCRQSCCADDRAEFVAIIASALSATADTARAQAFEEAIRECEDEKNGQGLSRDGIIDQCLARLRARATAGDTP